MKTYAIIVESENLKIRIPLMVSRTIDDLRFAYKDAKEKVAEYGMSTKIGYLDIKPKNTYIISSISEKQDDEWKDYDVEFDDENKDLE